MEIVAYVVWLAMGIIGIILGLINTVSKKFKGQEIPVIKTLFASGIYFTIFMAASTFVIYKRTGPSLAFMFTGIMCLAGINMIMGKITRGKQK